MYKSIIRDKSTGKPAIQLFLLLGAGLLFLLIISQPDLWEYGLKSIFPDLSTHIYARATLTQLTFEHTLIVAVSSTLAIAVGVSLGISVTRNSGKDFLPVVERLSSIGQTFPPVAVLALAVPILGFGLKPTILALFIYGLLPITRNTIAGIQSIDTGLLEAARGMGMSPIQVLLKVELPLAVTIILSGIRTSIIINIGTATVGATIGAGGLGVPIISGLVNDNPALLLQGAIPAACLAILADSFFNLLESSKVYGK